ncbi:MAG: TIM-barrel domain-containing protein [Casimicrobiaceae bacterium]
MPFDASSYLRLDAPHCVGTSAVGATFATSSGDLLEVSTYGPGVFRLRVGPQTRPDYGLLVGKSKSCEVTQEGGTSRFRSGAATLEIDGEPLAFRLSIDHKPVLESITDRHLHGPTRLPAFGRVRQGGQWSAAVALGSGEPVYGLGEKFGPLNKRGTLLHSWVQDAMGVNTGLSQHEVPFAWSPGIGHGAWGLFVHTPGAVIHGVGHPDWSHRTYAIVVDDEALDVFLFAAETPAAILGEFAELTGRAPAVPVWSLGLAWSRIGQGSAEDAVRNLENLRARRIPCDLVMLEAATLASTGHRFDMQWPPERFADPVGTMAALARHGARTCVWESAYLSIDAPLIEPLAASASLLRNDHGAPYVLAGSFVSSSSAESEAGAGAHDCALLDLTSPTTLAWWRDAHAEAFDAGVAAIEIDSREYVPDDAVAANGDRGVRLHNVHPVLLARAAYDAIVKFGNPADAPPLVLARGGWTGTQRVAVHLGGEAQSDWEALAATVRGALSLAMSGVPLVAMTAPGTYPATASSPELALRWLQAALFASHCVVRATAEREPWAYGTEAEAIARKWLAFRYRLIPYLLQAIDTATRTGLPVMRAMPLAYPGNALVRNYETQFLCGESLLVAPIVRAGGDVEIALPPGGWFDLNSRQRIPGQRVLRYRATADQFPIFGREGHALPLGKAVQHTGEIDASRPLASVWLFGVPTHPLAGFTQARISAEAETMKIAVARDVKVERFGDATRCEVAALP